MTQVGPVRGIARRNDEGAAMAAGAAVIQAVARFSVLAGVRAPYRRDRSRDLRYTLDYQRPSY